MGAGPPVAIPATPTAPIPALTAASHLPDSGRGVQAPAQAVSRHSVYGPAVATRVNAGERGTASMPG